MPNHILQVLSNELSIISNNIQLKNEKHPSIDYKNKICLKPWGHEFLVYQNTRLAIWCLTVKKGYQTSLHCHFNKDTQIIVLKGAANIALMDNKNLYLSELSTAFLPHYNFHGISAFSDEVVLLEIEIFNDGLLFSDKNDLLRINDSYHREKTGYESSVKILESNEDLQKYGYFYLDENFTQNIHNVDIQVSKITNKNHIPSYNWKNKQCNILLEGTLFQNNQFFKEGTFINDFSENIQFPQDTAVILSLQNIEFINNSKIIYDNNQLKIVTDILKSQSKTIILSSGCFDIIHVGHLNTLLEAKKLGDILIICLSSDQQIKKLKGNDRPINNYQDRINLFKTIDYVDYIVLYDEEDISNESTLGTIMKIVDPDYWVKGNDYTKNNIIKKHPYLRNICLIENIADKSTTNIIKTILKKG